MTFGEKLKALRKEKGYSQEEFAEVLFVSRQAVSKWEGDRGMPEVNTLIQISNMFGVTLDYLLKEESQAEADQSGGYYVSREMIEGFLSYKKRRAEQLAAGVGVIVLSDVFGCFSGYRQALLPLYWGCMAAGIAVLIWCYFQPKRYQEIYVKPLIFDEAVIKEFREKSDRNRKIYAGMVIAGILLLFFGSELCGMFKNMIGNETGNAAQCIMDAVSVVLLIIAWMSIHAEKIITQNQEYLIKKQSRGKYVWIYAAIPVTAIAVWAGLATNAWSPYMPVAVLLCILLAVACRLLIEKRDSR